MKDKLKTTLCVVLIVFFLCLLQNPNLYSAWDYTRPNIWTDTGSTGSTASQANFSWLNTWITTLFGRWETNVWTDGADTDGPGNMQFAGPVRNIDVSTYPIASSLASPDDCSLLVDTSDANNYILKVYNSTEGSFTGVAGVSMTGIAGLRYNDALGTGRSTPTSWYFTENYVNIMLENGLRSTQATENSIQKITLDGDAFLQQDKTWPIHVSGVGLDESAPPEVSWKSHTTCTYLKYKTLLFDDTNAERIHYDTDIPSNVSTTYSSGNVYIDATMSPEGDATSGHAVFAMYFVPYAVTTTFSDYSRDLSVYQITNTCYSVTTTRYFDTSLTNTAYRLPFTMTYNLIEALSRVYLTIVRQGHDAEDTFKGDIRMLHLGMRGKVKNVD
ncbi:MAG: hypothetical protein GY853_13355 [PVC group bacterium]|nr:hypothetical protein [PVC group bacterium]